jgi:hypothetical protein
MHALIYFICSVYYNFGREIELQTVGMQKRKRKKDNLSDPSNPFNLIHFFYQVEDRHHS